MQAWYLTYGRSRGHTIFLASSILVGHVFPLGRLSWEFRDSSHGEAYQRGSMVVMRGPARDYAYRDITVYPGSGPSRMEVKPLLSACFILSGQ
jgi:hypothetical protein